MPQDFPKNLVEFTRTFATAEACAEYLMNLRWPAGFVCPACAAKKGWPTARGGGVGKALVAVAVELEGRKIGRIRLRHIPDATGPTLEAFLRDSVEPGAAVRTDGWSGYAGLAAAGYAHYVAPTRGDHELTL